MPATAGSRPKIRQVFEAEDFGAEFTPELKEEAQRIYEQVSNRK